MHGVSKLFSVKSQRVNIILDSVAVLFLSQSFQQPQTRCMAVFQSNFIGKNMVAWMWPACSLPTSVLDENNKWN